MILSQISYLDCIVFLIFLTPQLLIKINIFELLLCILQALPFFLIKLPLQLATERFFTSGRHQSPFVKQASFFQDFVIRCVRYAFAFFPPKIARVFFSKPVALPFIRFRMLRHGYIRSPIQWREIDLGITRGVYISLDETQQPDLVLYHCHGGGFAAGSCYFYLEFLLAWITLLKDAGYKNPAIFSLEYTLVPDAQFPAQLEQTVSGYNYVLSIAKNSSRVCLGGDSAGATLLLSLLLYIASNPVKYENLKPGYITLISPWVTLVSSQNRNTASDYLNSNSLHLYGLQYAGSDEELDNPLASPGVCKDTIWWAKACPLAGFGIMFGSEEVLGPEMRDLIALLRKSGCGVSVKEEPGSIHAWPVVVLFLSDTQAERQKGVRDLTKMIKQAIPPKE